MYRFTYKVDAYGGKPAYMGSSFAQWPDMAEDAVADMCHVPKERRKKIHITSWVRVQDDK